jgi:Aldo/keto reductase family
MICGAEIVISELLFIILYKHLLI